jgi:threonine synthase
MMRMDTFMFAPLCGGNLDVILDYDQINQRYQVSDITCQEEPSLWRYLPLLPVSDPGGHGTPLHAAGWTPLYAPPLLARNLGLRQLWIKDEGRNPTASFKDRASSQSLWLGRARSARRSL